MGKCPSGEEYPKEEEMSAKATERKGQRDVFPWRQGERVSSSRGARSENETHFCRADSTFRRYPRHKRKNSSLSYNRITPWNVVHFKAYRFELSHFMVRVNVIPFL